MSTLPGNADEPISAEVATVGDREQHELDKLRERVTERALQAAARAEGAAMVASHRIDDLSAQLGGRVAVVEDRQREDGATLKALVAVVSAVNSKVDTLLARSPIQQALYALTALVMLAYFTLLLWDRLQGTGAG